MGKLHIYIKGLAICHFVSRDKGWNVFFPKVSSHEFQIEIVKSVNSGDPIVSKFTLPKGSEINLQALGKDGDSTDQGDLKQIINLSNLLIQPQVPPTNDIPLYKPHENYSAILTLHGVTLDQYYVDYAGDAENDFNEYEVWEKFPSVDTKPPYKSQILPNIKMKNAVKSSTTFSTASNTKTVINVKGEYNFNVELEHTDDTSYEISLNNHCEKSEEVCESETDFKFYYNIVDESNTKTIELIRVIPPGKGRRTGCDVVYADAIIWV
jgi:hypothetical protein